MGDAKSLQGGTLLVTPLFGADGQIYALARARSPSAASRRQGEAASVTRGVPTAGRIANGAIVEREIGFTLASQTQLKLSLHNPDLTTATRIADARQRLSGRQAVATGDRSRHRAARGPADYHGGVVGLLTDVEQVKVDPDQPAKVVIDEQSGVIVMGSDVRISTVAIAQGNLTIKRHRNAAGQPARALLSTGTTQVVPRTQIQIDDSKGNKMAVLHDGVACRSWSTG